MIDQSKKGVLIDSVEVIVSELVDAGECVNPITTTAFPLVVGGYFKYRETLLGEGYPTAVPGCLYQLIKDQYGLDPEHIHIRMAVKDTPDQDTAITLENTIFFPSDFDFFDLEQNLTWLLHEIEHISQWHKKGVADFIGEWVCASGVTIDRFDLEKIHNGMQLEKAAEAKAAEVIDAAWEVCHQPGAIRGAISATSGKKPSTHGSGHHVGPYEF